MPLGWRNKRPAIEFEVGGCRFNRAIHRRAEEQPAALVVLPKQPEADRIALHQSGKCRINADAAIIRRSKAQHGRERHRIWRKNSDALRVAQEQTGWSLRVHRYGAEVVGVVPKVSLS
jgi:hypothetical protein